MRIPTFRVASKASKFDKTDKETDKESIMRRVSWPTLFLGLLVSSAESVHAAPQQVLNKTISWSYTVQSMMRDPDGKTQGFQTRINYTVYVSSAGRFFERSSRSSG